MVTNSMPTERANEDPHKTAMTRGLPPDLQVGQSSEWPDFDDMDVLEWIKETVVPIGT